VNDTWQGHYAGIVSRGGAFVVDVIVVTIVTSGAVFFTQALIAMLNGKLMGEVTINPELALLATTWITFIYFVLGWTVFGRTGGEALFGLRVARPNGGRVHLARAALRFIVFFPSILLFGIGLWWILIDKRRRSWADIAARTVVVYDWGPEPRLVEMAGESGVHGG
jgi:uncharacterized RDD family membrane protein YckC